jgi:hypothetical protein
MLRRWLLALVVMSLVPVALSLPSEAGSPVLGAGRYIVVLKDTAPGTATAVAGKATGLGATIERLFGAVNTLVVSLSPREAARLRQDQRVAFVTPDRPVRLLADEVDDGEAAAPVVPTGVARIGAADRKSVV